MVSAWVVGDVVGGSVIVRSRDGGATWSVVDRESQQLFGIDFVDRDRGWAVGQGTILHTEDGGTTWTHQEPNVADPSTVGALKAVTFVTPTDGVIVGARPGAPLPDQPGGPALILLTRDAGTHWQLAPIDARGNSALEHSTLAFACFTTSGIALSCGEGLNTIACVLSSDTGASWVDVSDRIVGRNGACVGSGDIWVLRGGPLLSHSVDGGVTWVDMTDRLPPGDVGELLGVVFTSVSVGWLSGTDPNGRPLIIHTTDSGLTWSRQTVPEGQAGLSAISFVGSNGISVGTANGSSSTAGLALRTVDDGAGWTVGSLPSDITHFDSFDALSLVP